MAEPMSNDWFFARYLVLEQEKDNTAITNKIQ
jgi:hypothetical protein